LHLKHPINVLKPKCKVVRHRQRCQVKQGCQIIIYLISFNQDSGSGKREKECERQRQRKRVQADNKNIGQCQVAQLVVNNLTLKKNVDTFESPSDDLSRK
jgi:hypothetical protein